MATVCLPSSPNMEVLETDSLSSKIIFCSLSSSPFESASDQNPYHQPYSIAGGEESSGVNSGERFFSSQSKNSQKKDISASLLDGSFNASLASVERFPEAIPTEISSTNNIKAAIIGVTEPTLFDMALVESQSNGLYNSNLSGPQSGDVMATRNGKRKPHILACKHRVQPLL